MASVPATVVDTWEKFTAGPPGTIMYARNQAGELSNLLMQCAGCGAISSLPLEGAKRTCGARGPSWRLVHGEPLDGQPATLQPSVYHRIGGCGWHGWLKAGQWEAC